MSNPFESESRSVMWPDVPEPRADSPCSCGGDHVDWVCPNRHHIEYDYCSVCREEITYSANGMAYCECGHISE